GVTTSQKMWAHASKPAPSVRERRPDVPADLAAVIERLMAKKPADRYQTPTELRAALAPFAEGGATAVWQGPAPRPKAKRGWLTNAAALLWPAPGRASAGVAWKRWAAVAGSVAGGLLLAVIVAKS